MLSQFPQTFDLYSNINMHSCACCFSFQQNTRLWVYTYCQPLISNTCLSSIVFDLKGLLGFFQMIVLYQIFSICSPGFEALCKVSLEFFHGLNINNFILKQKMIIIPKAKRPSEKDLKSISCEMMSLTGTQIHWQAWSLQLLDEKFIPNT